MFDKKKNNQENNEQQQEEKVEAPKEEEDKYVHILKEDYAKMLDEKKKLTEEVDKYKNAYYQAYADTQNLRKSLEEDHRNALRYRAEGFIDNLLPALDSFYFALKATPNSQEAKNYQMGFQFIYNQIQQALSNEGVTEIEPTVGEEFDPTRMQALDVEEIPDEEPEHKITKVMSKGYKLHDRLVKPAMVVVGKHKAKPAEESATDKNEANEA